LTSAGRTIARAALFMMITTAIARILGFAREAVMVTLFGQNYLTDAYRAAFSIPDFIYMLLVGGALSAAFIPVFSSYISNGREKEAWESASVVFNYIVLLLLILIAVAYFFTAPLIRLLAPGLPPTYAALAISLTHVMFIQTFFMALSGISQGILNSYNEFAAPAIGSVLYNLFIIILGIALVKQFGIQAFAIGVVIGAVFNFVVQIPALRRVGIHYHFTFDYKNPGFVKIMILVVPVLLGLSVSQFNLFVTQNLASSVGAGMISALNLAQKIMNLPVGIFGVAIATAIFPTLTTLAARGEMADFRRRSSLGLRAIFLVTIPSAFGLAALGEPLIKLLFQQGQFTEAMANTTFQVLLYFCVGLAAYAGIMVLNRSFYALKDTLTPLLAAVATIGLNVFLSLQLADIMGVRGLALATSLSGIFNLLVLFVVLRIKSGPLGGRKMMRSLTISVLGSTMMYFVVNYSTEFIQQWLPWADKINQLIGVTAGIGLGVIVYGLIVHSLKLEESELILKMIGQKIPGLSRSKKR